MNNRQILGIAGSALLLVGVFLPLMKLPFVGEINYFQNGRGDGVFVLVFALGSLTMVLARQYSGLWLTGLGSAGIMAFSFFNIQSKISSMQGELDSQLAGNPFRGLADIAMQSVQFQWGWAVLLLGAIAVLATAAWKEPTPETVAPPSARGADEVPASSAPGPTFAMVGIVGAMVAGIAVAAWMHGKSGGARAGLFGANTHAQKLVVQQAVMLAAGPKTPLTEYRVDRDRWPDTIEEVAGLTSSPEHGIQLRLETIDPATARIVARINSDTGLEGDLVLETRDGGRTYLCFSPDLPPKVLPAACRP